MLRFVVRIIVGDSLLWYGGTLTCYLDSAHYALSCSIEHAIAARDVIVRRFTKLGLVATVSIIPSEERYNDNR